MTFTRCVTLLVLVLGSGLTVPAAAEEADFYRYNQEAMVRHDTAMYQLVDELADCAGYYSMLMASGSASASPLLSASEHKAVFVALGADALTTLVPGPRSSRLLEMEARIISSQRSLVNTFGSLGGMAESETEKMIRTCERLRASKRRVFGWTRISTDD